jgi:hypothetical protein
VGPRAGLDDVEKIQDSNSDLSVLQPVASCYTDCAIPAHRLENLTYLFLKFLTVKMNSHNFFSLNVAVYKNVFTT